MSGCRWRVLAGSKHGSRLAWSLGQVAVAGTRHEKSMKVGLAGHGAAQDAIDAGADQLLRCDEAMPTGTIRTTPPCDPRGVTPRRRMPFHLGGDGRSCEDHERDDQDEHAECDEQVDAKVAAHRSPPRHDGTPLPGVPAAIVPAATLPRLGVRPVGCAEENDDEKQRKLERGEVGRTGLAPACERPIAGSRSPVAARRDS